MRDLTTNIFTVNENSFDATALQIFKFQYESVAIYRAFCDALKRNSTNVSLLKDIPFLPVQFFKTHAVIAEGIAPEKVFESSTTSGSVPSKHYVTDLELYETSFQKSFNLFYGDVSNYAVLALLPSYMERGTSSLLMMAHDFIGKSKYTESCFIADDFEGLYQKLITLKEKKAKILLLGVTYALLDFAAQFQIDLSDAVIMETGGMKGRRAEITREEVHAILKNAFCVSNIHSEYGMTEMLSQAYSKANGIYQSPPWMRVVLRDIYDPLNLDFHNKTGAVNVIDFANYYSCSFIATNDLGKMHVDGSFEILGRMDNAEIRGCNLMYV